MSCLLGFRVTNASLTSPIITYQRIRGAPAREIGLAACTRPYIIFKNKKTAAKTFDHDLQNSIYRKIYCLQGITILSRVKYMLICSIPASKYFSP